MRMVLHGYFNPKSMEKWRPMIQSAIKFLLDQAEEKGEMDVMQDFATPLPLLVIASMMGVPEEDRPYIRDLSKKILLGGAASAGRTKRQAQDNMERREYLGTWIEGRLAKPTDGSRPMVFKSEKTGNTTRDKGCGHNVHVQ